LSLFQALKKRKNPYMDAVRSKCNLVVQKLNTLIQPRIKIYLWGETCEPQSACAKSAREIVVLIERKKETDDQDLRIKEEIMVILDHDHLISEFRCNALALLTLSEALRLLIQCKASENKVSYLEKIVREVEGKFSTTPKTSIPEDAPNIKMLIYKHQGNGVKYLTEIWKERNSRDSNVIGFSDPF